MKRKTKIIINIILSVSIVLLFALFLQFLILIIKDIVYSMNFHGYVHELIIANHLQYYYPYCIVSLLHIGVDIFMLYIFNKKDLAAIQESILQSRKEKQEAKKAKEIEHLNKRLEELNKD